MAAVTGYFCKLYRNTGTYGSPTWTEIATARDVTSTLEKAEIDASVRGGNGWKQSVAGLKEMTIEAEILFDTTDAGFTALQSAFFGNTTVDVLALSGPVATPGNQGPRAVCEVLSFTRNEGMQDVLTVSVTFRPAAGPNAPTWFTSS